MFESRQRFGSAVATSVLAVVISPDPARAQGAAAPSDEALTEAAIGEIAAASQNPLGDVIDVPLESNFNNGYGPKRRSQYVLNLQPDMPIEISTALDVVVQATLPFVAEPIAGSDRRFGLGDVNLVGYLALHATDALTLGVGPTIQLPTATSAAIGAGNWAAGPAAVVDLREGRWVVGIIASQLWSFASSHEPMNVNAAYVQPYVNCNLPRGWILSSAPQAVANWSAAPGQTLTVPVGGGFGRVLKVENHLLAVGLEVYWNAVHPDDGATWQVRTTIALLIPRRWPLPTRP